MNKPPDETLKQGRNRSWLLVKFEVLPQYGIFDHYCQADSATNSTKRDCSGQTKQYQVNILYYIRIIG